MYKRALLLWGLAIGSLTSSGESSAQMPLPPEYHPGGSAAWTGHQGSQGETAGRAGDYIPPRGLLQRETAAGKGEDPFIPFMLGDFVGSVANLFNDARIAEGESPRPMDRVYYRFNYFNNVDKSRWKSLTESIKDVNLYRHIFGFEVTFFDRSVSIGVRIPFYTVTADGKDFALTTTTTSTLPGVPQAPSTGPTLGPGDPGFSATYFGNLNVIVKALLWEDRQTERVFSGGLLFSTPTASTLRINPGQSNLMYVEPFLAFILPSGDFFLQGFLSMNTPVAHTQGMVLFNDIGVGYFLYRDRSGSSFLTAVAPTIEAHVASALRQPNAISDPLTGTLDDIPIQTCVVNLTFGTTFEFINQATLGLAVVVPVVGPKPFDVEALAQLNYRF